MSYRRTLSRIAIGGSIVSALCLASGCALTRLLPDGGETITREIPWDGSEHMVVDVPADVVFTQEPGPGKLIATGPRRSVETLRVTQGHVHDTLLHTGTRLLIVVSAPSVKAFSLKGGDRLRIAGFDQDRLTIAMTGRSELQAAGRAGELELNMTGFGSADLGELGADRASIGMSGWTKARVAPMDAARLRMQGFTEVSLATEPRELDEQLSGRARVVREGPESRD